MSAESGDKWNDIVLLKMQHFIHGTVWQFPLGSASLWNIIVH